MRPDFNKVLVENARIGHSMNFGQHRKIKAFNTKDEDGNLTGGREGMKVRHKYVGNTKKFNENLGPLLGWLRQSVGKNWNKQYSELRQQFDARSVINNHILQHLFQYVELHCRVIDGKVMAAMKYSSTGYVPVKESNVEFYVCPKDGTLKFNNRLTRNARYKLQTKAKEVAEAKLTRQIDASNVLHLINGIWFHFQLADLPVARTEVVPPPGMLLTHPPGHVSDPFAPKAWSELLEHEREKIGVKKIVYPKVYDLFLDMYVDRGPHPWTGRKPTPNNKYHATKATASHKMLKQAGLV